MSAEDSTPDTRRRFPSREESAEAIRLLVEAVNAPVNALIAEGFTPEQARQIVAGAMGVKQ